MLFSIFRLHAHVCESHKNDDQNDRIDTETNTRIDENVTKRERRRVKSVERTPTTTRTRESPQNCRRKEYATGAKKFSVVWPSSRNPTKPPKALFEGVRTLLASLCIAWRLTVARKHFALRRKPLQQCTALKGMCIMISTIENFPHVVQNLVAIHYPMSTEDAEVLGTRNKLAKYDVLQRHASTFLAVRAQSQLCLKEKYSKQE